MRTSRKEILMNKVRRILQAAVSGSDRLGDLAVEMFGASEGADLDLPEHEPAEPVDFDR
jgi:hypothetical protein